MDDEVLDYMEEDIQSNASVEDDDVSNLKTGNYFSVGGILGKILNSKLFGSKKFVACIAFLNALLITFAIYKNVGMYNPRPRTFLEDNIFSGSEIVADQAELSAIVERLEDELSITIDDNEASDYYIFDAVVKNKNLTDEEKQLFYKCFDLIKDNPYLNKEEAYKSLLNVDIVYKNRPVSMNKSIQAVYIYSLENIGVFEDDSVHRALMHEIIHCIYSNEKTANLPSFFREGMTELLANEYFEANPFCETNSYMFEISAIKMLCEITSADTVLKAFSYGDMGIIADEMETTSGCSREEAMECFDALEKILSAERDKNGRIIDRSVLDNKFLTTFGECIDAKYSSDSLSKYSYIYNKILFSNIFSDNPYNDYVEDVMEYGYDFKAYFSTGLKKSLAEKSVIEKLKK